MPGDDGRTGLPAELFIVFDHQLMVSISTQ